MVTSWISAIHLIGNIFHKYRHISLSSILKPYFRYTCTIHFKKADTTSCNIQKIDSQPSLRLHIVIRDSWNGKSFTNPFLFPLARTCYHSKSKLPMNCCYLYLSSYKQNFLLTRGSWPPSSLCTLKSSQSSLQPLHFRTRNSKKRLFWEAWYAQVCSFSHFFSNEYTHTSDHIQEIGFRASHGKK